MKNLEFKKVDDKTEWNSFVLSQQRYSFVQSFEYTEVLKALVNEIVRIGVYKEDKLIALLPMGIIRAKRGNYLRLRHGPILSTSAQSKEIFDEIVKYLEVFAKEQKLTFVRIQPILEDPGLLRSAGFSPAPTHNLDGEHTLQLNLRKFEGSEEKVKQNMRKNTRYYIRKSFKEGIEVIKDNTDFDNFYKILKNTSQRQDYTTWPKEYFENLFKYFNTDKLNLYFAEYEGKRVGIGLFVDFGVYRFYLEGGMDMAYSKKYPAYAIQWTSIKEALEKGVSIYDFWGGVTPRDAKGEPIKNYPWAGINLFKGGFGGEEVHMIHPYDKHINKMYWLTWFVEMVEKKRRGY